MPLSNIVNVQITRESQSVSEAGFGSLMILGANKNWNDLIRQYSDLQEVAMDFNPYDPEYIASQSFFSQPITPPSLYIGRRTVDTVGILVETAMANQNYTATINGNPVTVSSNTTVQDSVLTLTGIMTYVITFSTDFNTGTTAITPTVNGVSLASTAWTTDQATTIAAVATVIGAAAGVTSATPSGDVITVVFASSATATIESCTVVGTGSQPTVVITNDGPLVASNTIAVTVNGTPLSGTTFATDSLTTLTVIGNKIKTYLNGLVSPKPGIANFSITGVNNNILTVTSNPNQAGVITNFVVSAGSSQATAGIVNSNQPTDKNTIADALSTAINADVSINALVIASTPSVPNGTLSITVNTPGTPAGTPYTLAVSTDITDPVQARVLITQAEPNQGYTVILNGQQFVYLAPNSVTGSDQISLALTTSINSPILLDMNLNPVMQNSQTVPNPNYGIINASDNGNGSFEVTSAAVFQISVTPFEAMVIEKGLIIAPYQPSASAVTDLQAIQAVNDDWYALACLDRTQATVQSIAGWIETQIKIFGTASNNPIIVTQPPGVGSGLDSTSIAYYLFNKQYARSFCLYNEDALTDYPEVAWFSTVLWRTPGSETWAFKQLATISYSDLSSNQEANAFAKNCNTYEYIGGVNITQRGTMAVGEYIDIIRGVDWLTSTIQTYVYSVLVNLPKVPYTNKGITAIEGQIRKALNQGIDNDFIASEPPYEIFVPDATTVPSIDKANRILRNVSFNATLAGAIQAVQITGTVSV